MPKFVKRSALEKLQRGFRFFTFEAQIASLKLFGKLSNPQGTRNPRPSR